MPRKRIYRPVSFFAATLALLLQSVWLGLPSDAAAQRPFFANDPLYRDETARRDYYDGYAVSGELSYRSLDGGYASGAGNLGVIFKLDYELTPQFDVSAILDAFGGFEAQSLNLAWLSVKHYWHRDGADMALRVAFEPRPPIGGGIGFRQTDVGFFYSKVLSPTVETEMAIGVRDVRTGFQGIEQLEEGFGPTETRGYEAHLVLGYNFVFDPARSHISFSLGYEAGRYDLTKRLLAPTRPGPGQTSEFSGHVLWVQTGFHWHRPSYQLVPYLSVPLAVGKDGEGPIQGKGPQYVNVGVRLTLR